MTRIQRFGGPDGELGAATRYLSQRYTMPYKNVAGLLTDIATEEMGHEEIVCAIVYQLTRNLSMSEIENSSFMPYYVNHTLGIYPASAAGDPFTASALQSKGDPITDLHEDMAAEQKARSTYDNLLRLARDYPDVYAPLHFLREREIVHYQRFGEGLNTVLEHLDSQNYFIMNPSFDNTICK